MSDHVVDQIAERVKELLIDATCADENVFRDRSPVHPWQRSELPGIDIQIGEDNPVDLVEQVVGRWTSIVEIDLDLYVHAAADDLVSSAVLQLRKESYIAVMASMPALSQVGDVLSIYSGGATGIERGSAGDIPMAVCRTPYFVRYRHSLTDPSQ